MLASAGWGEETKFFFKVFHFMISSREHNGNLWVYFYYFYCKNNSQLREKFECCVSLSEDEVFLMIMFLNGFYCHRSRELMPNPRITLTLNKINYRNLSKIADIYADSQISRFPFILRSNFEFIMEKFEGLTSDLSQLSLLSWLHLKISLLWKSQLSKVIKIEIA